MMTTVLLVDYNDRQRQLQEDEVFNGVGMLPQVHCTTGEGGQPGAHDTGGVPGSARTSTTGKHLYYEYLLHCVMREWTANARRLAAKVGPKVLMDCGCIGGYGSPGILYCCLHQYGSGVLEVV